MLVAINSTCRMFSKHTLAEKITTWTTQNEDGGRYFHGTFESKTKGEVPYNVYLPPGWHADDTTTYPLLIYIYGQGGTEYIFPYHVEADLLNQWINNGDLPPMVVFCPNGSPDPEVVQWYSPENEAMLTKEKGEIRAFCRQQFRAGMQSDLIGLEGQSRGAAGVLFYAMKHSNKFSSFVANAYVSDYNLKMLKDLAQENQLKVQQSAFYLKMEIGSEDYFMIEHKRKGSLILDQYLTDLKIPHTHEILKGRGHGYGQFWDYYRKDKKMLNGLFHLKYHANIWNK
ncbi:MAG: enterochelin esterase-like enzyme [Paraglaciecola sp.]